MATPDPSPARKLLSVAWIPHWALLGGQAAHGASWGLLFALGAAGTLGLSFPALAWVHVVALGYLTLISLAVLIHVLHGMLDLDWVAAPVARWSLLPFAAGSAGMAWAFWTGQMGALAVASSVVGAALAVYLSLAAATLARFRPSEDASPAVMRAFSLVLTMLAVTAVLGVGMAWALAGQGHAWWLTVAPLMHAHTGLVGWLSLLVVGVSMHTVKPITGGRSDAVWRHIAASSLVLAGLLALLVGFGTGVAGWLWAGAIAGFAGTALYLSDMVGILARARVKHRPPQAFLAASSVYFVTAAALGAGVLAGKAEWQTAYVFVALIGWLGQMVNGHLYHIGIRVLATVARGEDDETRPVELLSLPLSWASWAAFQSAVVLGAVGLMTQAGPLVCAAAALGLTGWVVMGANIAHAWRQANREPATAPTA
ncbi:hypothetical protein D3C72_649290 [compost metagenome]